MKATDEIRKAADAADAEYERLKASAELLSMKVMPVERCVGSGQLYGRLGDYTHRFNSIRFSYDRTATPQQLHTFASGRIAEARVKAIEVHDRNAGALANNAKIRDALSQLMPTLGFPPTYTTREMVGRKRDPQAVHHRAGWSQDLDRVCLTADNFTTAVHELDELQRKLDAELAAHVAQEQAAAKARQEELLRQSAVTEAIAYLSGQGLKAPDDYTVETAVAVARARRQSALEYLAEHWLEVLRGGSARFEEVSDTLEGTWRWGTEHYLTVRDTSTGRLYGAGYRRQPEMGLEDCNSGAEWEELPVVPSEGVGG